MITCEVCGEEIKGIRFCSSAHKMVYFRANPDKYPKGRIKVLPRSNKDKSKAKMAEQIINTPEIKKQIADVVTSELLHNELEHSGNVLPASNDVTLTPNVSSMLPVSNKEDYLEELKLLTKSKLVDKYNKGKDWLTWNKKHPDYEKYKEKFQIMETELAARGFGRTDF